MHKKARMYSYICALFYNILLENHKMLRYNYLVYISPSVCCILRRGDGMCDNQEKQKDLPQDDSEIGQRLQMMEDTGSVTTDNGRHRIHCMTIVGQIEGHYALPSETKATKYEHMIPQLVAVDESTEIEGLLLVLNTVGGDIEAGLALAELIAGMNKPTVSLVLGGGHSIGVPLAVAADCSFIVPSATMTIHPVRVNGLVLGVPQAFTHFQRMQERIVDFVCSHSRMSADRFHELCMNTDELATDVGSVLDGSDAVEEGLIDRLGSLHEALETLYDMIEKSKSCP